MEKILRSFRLSRCILLVAGTSIGGGMLGIPLVTGAAGFWPAVIISILVWAFMTITGLLLLEVTLKSPNKASFLTIANKYLGKPGYVVTGALFMFLYYFLLIAYFAALSPLIASFLNISPQVTLVFLAGGFILLGKLGPKYMDGVNYIFTICMGVALLAFFVLYAPEVQVDRLLTFKFSKILFAAPILFSAFGFHNIVPSLVSYVGKDKKLLQTTIVAGTTITLLVYIIWQWLIIGCVPIELINAISSTGEIGFLNGWPCKIFAFFAITTSLIGVSFSLMDFVRDGTKIENRYILSLLTFLPPVLIAGFDPGMFEKALSIAGGIGEAILNGMIPLALCFSSSYIYKELNYKWPILAALFSVATLVLAIELFHLAF